MIEKALPAIRHRLRGRPGRSRKPGNDDGASTLEITDEERRFLSVRYDERVALPAGAAEYLTTDNPRLADLRRAYARLRVPAVEHSQWDPENVSGYLDLQYFRGDSMIQWHYRELPRATRLKMFIYLSHVESVDEDRFLARLSEDGLFGCWTYEFPDHPTVSRDLLDSVNELRFLNRHLAILDRRSLRVLDIGAGYGRLAHRMAESVPVLTDYCCVDAVPESTFLSEYYLRFRGCTPPTRVVALQELDSLDPGRFDLAINVHSFSECTYAAVEWWLERLRELEVPMLFVVPNEPDGFLSKEVDGRRDLMPALEAAGYRLAVREPVISEPAAREMTRIRDQFHLFALSDDR